MVLQTESNELYHHGVKGQHWGKRNGPPYPLYRKSVYYKKTGKRHPGYTGNKSGKESSSGRGKIGGVTISDKSASSMYKRERNKRIVKLAGAGLLGVGAARNAVGLVRTAKDANKMVEAAKGTRLGSGMRTATKLGVGAAAGITALGGLAAYGLYRSSRKNKKRMEELSKERRGSIGGLDDFKNKGNAKNSENKESIKTKLISRYKKQAIENGMSETAANKYAKERYKSTMKSLAIAGGVVGAAALATAAYKGGRYIKNEFMDETVKAGKKVQTLSVNPNRQADETFYGAHRLQDKWQYRGMANNKKGPTGWHASKDGKPPKVYRLNSVVTSDAKIASNKNSRKVFEELRAKDPDFKAYTDKLKSNFDNRDTRLRYIKNTDTYGAFNRDGLMYGKGDPTQNTKFFDAMKKRGYSGIKDINDRQLNTYQTDANIWFGNTNNYNSKLKTLQARDADYGRKAKDMIWFNKTRRSALTSLDRGGLIGTAAIGSGVGVSYNASKQRSKLKKYRRRKRR